MDSEKMRIAMADMQDAMIVMTHIEKRQSEMLKPRAEHLAEIEAFRHRTGQNLAEITDKLNRLIGYMDNQPS